MGQVPEALSAGFELMFTDCTTEVLAVGPRGCGGMTVQRRISKMKSMGAERARTYRAGHPCVCSVGKGDSRVEQPRSGV